DEHFAVTLWFKGKPARLSIPFEALTNFADPSVAFGLRFVDGAEEVEAASEETETAEESEKDQSDAQVISLDSFRKK
ncbi:MAG TPA: ClpXP protease specificity-enhancing factor SspB, partial [Parvularculaceae bacterium]|nr:ClpXP protease specificity-enhancing factor SspB [Parvularculaceae bacterium]